MSAPPGSAAPRGGAKDILALVDASCPARGVPRPRATAAYLNAGTDGPLPARASAAAARELEREAARGPRRWRTSNAAPSSASSCASAYARALGCEAEDVALTTCTSEGMAQVIAGLELARGDEILTSDEEHPGLLGALGAARAAARRGGPRGAARGDRRTASATDAPGRLLARRLDERQRRAGRAAPSSTCPVLLDGAQGVGAVPVDVAALGCDAYAGAGQKWLCGPDGTGMLYVAPARCASACRSTRRGYANLADPDAGLDAEPHPDARRFDAPSLSAETLACALAALELLERPAGRDVHERARRCSPRASPSCSPSAGASPPRAGGRRSCPSPAPIPRASARGSPRRA